MTVTATSLTDRYLLAQVADLTLVFAATMVAEIIRIERSKVLNLPFYDSQVAGIINHNGQLLPLISAHSLLQQASPRSQEIWTVMRLQLEDSHIGITVDRAIGNSTKAQLPPQLLVEHQVDAWVLMTPQLLPAQIWQPQQ
jgi:chemotaxis signal transduction protein